MQPDSRGQGQDKQRCRQDHGFIYNRNPGVLK
jgi:hypothetical protein